MLAPDAPNFTSIPFFINAAKNKISEMTFPQKNTTHTNNE